MLFRNKRKIFVYAAVVILLIFLYSFNILRPLENMVIKVLNPVLKNFYLVSSKFRIKYNEQTSIENLNDKVKKIEEERNKLLEENVSLKKAVEENEILREQLGFLTKNKLNYVVSNVVSRGEFSDMEKTPETITIDKGSKDGVYNGLAVVSGQGIIVGKIVETKDAIAKIYLSNNNRCKLAATIFSDSKTDGVTEGELGLTIRMNFIPQGVSVKKDDLVITSGLEEAIPRGLVIGKVNEVKSDSNDLWQEAIIEPIINPDNLIIVSVLLP